MKIHLRFTTLFTSGLTEVVTPVKKMNILASGLTLNSAI